MSRRLKTLALVVVLTGLIWAWAEQSQIATLREQSLQVVVQAPDDGMVLLAGEGGPGVWSRSATVPVTASFTGPQSAISELAGLIAQRKFPRALPLPAGDGATDHVELDLAQVLRDQPVLRTLHSGVAEVRPGRVTIQVTQLAEFKLDVEPAYSDLVSRQAKCVPDKAAVRLPRAVYDRLDRKVISPVVQVGPDTDLGQPISVALPTELDGCAIQPVPPTVTIITNVGLKDHRVENVPVQAVFPREFPWREYELVTEKDQWRKTIIARGPVERTLAAEDVQVYLRFTLNDIKPTAVQLSRDVDIHLPPGFTLVSPEPKKPERAINFSFAKRTEERAGP